MFHVAVTPTALDVSEVDALVGSVQVADHLTLDGDAPLGQRLVRGFTTTPERGAHLGLNSQKADSVAVAEPAWPRWVGAVGIMLGPSSDGATNLRRAGTGAALALAFALVILLTMRLGAGRFVAIATGCLVLISSGVMDAAAGSGYGAAAALAMALFLWGGQRVVDGRGAWLAALGMGLAAATHPGAAVLVVVLFVAFAISRRASDSLDELTTAERERLDRLGMITALPSDVNRERGLLDLPAAPVSLFLSPIVAVGVLIVAFPSMWPDLGSRFGLWFIEGFSVTAEPHSMAGVALDPRAARGATSWMALAQWVAWTTPPIAFLWSVGVVRAARRRRAGEWLPIVTTVGLLVVAMIDGGLFGARRSLLPLLWLPVAWTSANGLASTIDYAKSVSGPAVATLTAALLLIWPVAGAVVGTAPGAERFGAALRLPVPMSALAQLAADSPGETIRFDPSSHRWRSTIEPLLEEAEIDLLWSERDPTWRFVSSDATGPADEPFVQGYVRVNGLRLDLVGPTKGR